jgi:hypothetical protein
MREDEGGRRGGEIYENTRVKIHGKFNNNTEKELSMKRSS